MTRRRAARPHRKGLTPKSGATRVPGPAGAAGFTLVEVLIALTIGVLLVAGTLKTLDVIQVTKRTETLRAELQQNARFALDMLNRDLQQAGQGMDPNAEFGVVAAGEGGATPDTLYLLYALPDAPVHALATTGQGNAKSKMWVQITCGDRVEDLEAGDFVYVANGSARGVARVNAVTRAEKGTSCQGQGPDTDDGTVMLDVTTIDGEGHGWVFEGNSDGGAVTEVEAVAYFVETPEGGGMRLARSTRYEASAWQPIPVAEGVDDFQVRLVFTDGSTADLADAGDADPDNDYDDIDTVELILEVVARRTDKDLGGGQEYRRTYSVSVTPRNQLYSRNMFN